MGKPNIHDHHSLEAAYPADAFASDAAQNARSDGQQVSGVRILSAPDAAGNFALERAVRQVGETVSPAFLAPYRREDRLGDARRDAPTPVAAEPDPREGYDSFLAEIVAAAQRWGFNPEDSPGRADPRLRGLRQ
jgi:hypothetical protein